MPSRIELIILKACMKPLLCLHTRLIVAISPPILTCYTASHKVNIEKQSHSSCLFLMNDLIMCIKNKTDQLSFSCCMHVCGQATFSPSLYPYVSHTVHIFCVFNNLKSHILIKRKHTWYICTHRVGIYGFREWHATCVWIINYIPFFSSRPTSPPPPPPHHKHCSLRFFIAIISLII